MTSATKPVYLDYLATTPVCKEASQVMIDLLSKQDVPEGLWGNAGSEHHEFGRAAKISLENARAQVAKLLNCSAQDICFESGSTESINHAIKGVLQASVGHRDHVILSEYEHPAVMETVLASSGGHYTIVSPEQSGVVSADKILAACKGKKTALVTVMMVNNEIGSINPIREIVQKVKAFDSGIVIHCDASQAVGKIPVDVRELGVDLLTVAGHKFYAPKGIGALYIRPGTILTSFATGAGHEHGRRAGTENVLFAVALGEACEAAAATCLRRPEKYKLLREKLFNLIADGVGRENVIRNGPIEDSDRLPGALSISFRGGVYGSEVAAKAGKAGIAFSAGAACHSGHHKPSKVLKSIGMDDVSALGTIRLSIGRYTTEEEIECAAATIVDIVKSETLKI